jgi:HCOMODA/2-hydroxy-3-carboxy-muconic semialdehyde decarboxylase
MTDLERILADLVIANRILSHENVVDAYGHISVRHPQNPARYLLARSLAPEMVVQADIMEFELDGTPVGGDTRQPYLERFIHGAVYEARPEAVAVVHAHAEDVLPFGITTAPLRPVIHSGSFMGEQVPVWDIRDRFGDTNLLVTSMAQGRDLATRLAGNNVALMRGHGFVAAARSIIEAVRMSVYVPRNARVQMAAMQLGAVKPLSRGEIEARNAGYKPHSPETRRAWEYWAIRAGCRELLEKK